MLYRTQDAQRALSPTAISIADYVINPYQGCDFNCVYCYAKLNSGYQKKKKRFGEDFVEIKPNFIALLDTELAAKKPKHVLLSSTTESYQHIDMKEGMTRRVLETLNAHDVSCTILTKSHHIVRDIDHLQKNNANEIYFTVNTFDDALRARLEPHASTMAQRYDAMKQLHTAGIRVIGHVGPCFPGITDHKKIFRDYHAICEKIEFESLNLKMAEKTTLMDIIRTECPESYAMIHEIYAAKESYEDYYHILQHDIICEADAHKIKVQFFFYPFNSFYENTTPY